MLRVCFSIGCWLILVRAPARQQIVVQAPNGQRVTVQLPPNTRTGQRMQVKIGLARHAQRPPVRDFAAPRSMCRTACPLPTNRRNNRCLAVDRHQLRSRARRFSSSWCVGLSCFPRARCLFYTPFDLSTSHSANRCRRTHNLTSG